MQTNFNVTLAEYKPISTYRPKVGDFIIWHGWFTHYYGVINGMDDDRIKIVKSGMPILLLSMDPDEMDKNSATISLSKIKRSRGAYATQQNGIWYI